MDTYLYCEVTKGQFSDEWAVQGTTHTGSGFSLFVSGQYVDRDRKYAGSNAGPGWLHVDVLETDENRALVRLPGQTFENGKTVTVTLEQIKERDSSEYA